MRQPTFRSREFGAVAPPGVGPLEVGVEVAEGVREAGGEQLRHLAALLVGEAGVEVVGLGVFEVYLLVRDVHVPADDDGLLAVQRHQVRAEGVLPLHAVGKPLQLVLGVRRVDAHEVELLELQRDHAALGVVLGQAEVVARAEGLPAGEDGRAGIALALGVAPELLIARQVERQLPGLQLRLLQAEHVGVQAPEGVLKALFHNGPQAVDVPGYQPHSVCSPFTATRRFIFTPWAWNLAS